MTVSPFMNSWLRSGSGKSSEIKSSEYFIDITHSVIFIYIVMIYFRIIEHLGSGQFGCVNKGVWHSPDKSIDVAVKTLKKHASEEEMVKFLQEAAIMGQFHHPNIVKLHGVVTMGEPVSYVYKCVVYSALELYVLFRQ